VGGDESRASGDAPNHFTARIPPKKTRLARGPWPHGSGRLRDGFSKGVVGPEFGMNAPSPVVSGKAFFLQSRVKTNFIHSLRAFGLRRFGTPAGADLAEVCR